MREAYFLRGVSGSVDKDLEVCVSIGQVFDNFVVGGGIFLGFHDFGPNSTLNCFIETSEYLFSGSML